MLFNFIIALTLKYLFTEAAHFMSKAASKIPDDVGSTELRVFMWRMGQDLGMEMFGRGFWTTENEALDI